MSEQNRKVVQLVAAVTGVPFFSSDPWRPVEERLCQMLYALCDDGTMWAFDNNTNGWKPVKAIPQDGATA